MSNKDNVDVIDQEYQRQLSNGEFWVSKEEGEIITQDVVSSFTKMFNLMRSDVMIKDDEAAKLIDETWNSMTKSLYTMSLAFNASVWYANRGISAQNSQIKNNSNATLIRRAFKKVKLNSSDSEVHDRIDQLTLELKKEKLRTDELQGKLDKQSSSQAIEIRESNYREAARAERRAMGTAGIDQAITSFEDGTPFYGTPSGRLGG